MPLSLLETRNSLLGLEFDRYVREHPEFVDKIPNNAQVILLLEGDEGFNTWSTRVGKEQAAQNLPLLYVTIKKLAPAHSRIEELSLMAG
ncbi:MAG: hypothetical protein E8D46_17175 [Nitrospira sp.]|nr:MAG: hypothetical protein E8D46_17175 [Nitrospira sp.]